MPSEKIIQVLNELAEKIATNLQQTLKEENAANYGIRFAALNGYLEAFCLFEGHDEILLQAFLKAGLLKSDDIEIARLDVIEELNSYAELIQNSAAYAYANMSCADLHQVSTFYQRLKVLVSARLS